MKTEEFIAQLSILNYTIKINIMKNWPVISFFVRLWEERQRKKRFQKKLEELKKRDPFIYKNF